MGELLKNRDFIKIFERTGTMDGGKKKKMLNSFEIMIKRSNFVTRIFFFQRIYSIRVFIRFSIYAFFVTFSSIIRPLFCVLFSFVNVTM